jgi:hypothetical protein
MSINYETSGAERCSYVGCIGICIRRQFDFFFAQHDDVTGAGLTGSNNLSNVSQDQAEKKRKKKLT